MKPTPFTPKNRLSYSCSLLCLFLLLNGINGCLIKKDEINNGFRIIAEANLNELVAHIELYNLQHGRYPDSLRQLQHINSFVPIVDPVQGVNMRRNSLFNYGRVGAKYYLFSSGKDGIPHTVDDFYPSIDISDSSKIGLVIPPLKISRITPLPNHSASTPSSSHP